MIDVGAGTGFLSFLAHKLGAKNCTMIEVDEEIVQLSQTIAERYLYSYPYPYRRLHILLSPALIEREDFFQTRYIIHWINININVLYHSLI